jgi:hypothetical protein
MKEKSTQDILKIVAAWTIALVPLGWGLYNTLLKAMTLFKG